MIDDYIVDVLDALCLVLLIALAVSVWLDPQTRDKKDPDE